MQFHSRISYTFSFPFFAAPSSPFLWEFQDIPREEIRWMRWRKKRETYSNDQMLRQHSTKGNDKIGNVEINLMKTFFIDLMDFFSLSFRVGNGCLKGLAGKFQMSNVAKKKKRTRHKADHKRREWVSLGFEFVSKSIYERRESNRKQL